MVTYCEVAEPPLPIGDLLEKALALRDHLQAWATAAYQARKDALWKPEESEQQ